MALVRPLDVDCRWNYIYFTEGNRLQISGLGTFTIEQFFAVVNAYPKDFPEDILYRLACEQEQMINSLQKLLNRA